MADEKPLRILIVEDSEDDAELLRRHIAGECAPPVVHRVDSASGLIEGLEEGSWDAVLCDYMVPGFSAHGALDIVKDSGLDIPFIVVSGTMQEETLVEMMKLGTQDVITKDRLSRLVPAIRRGVEDAVIRRQQKETQRQLVQAQKMEAIGQLTGGIAHDFNNILAVILGNLQIMQRRMGDGDETLRDLAEVALQATLRGADLTKQLLAFSRRQNLEPQAFDPNELVRKMDVILRRTLGEQIEIQMLLGEGLRSVKADPMQLQTAILNLAINARDAMPEGGKLIIETSAASVDKVYQDTHPYALPGPYVCFAVTDTGAGISDDILGNIFEPFFTTKEVGKGTGLGLSITYGFVKQSGGHIGVYSEEGRGTCFRIYLPQTDEEGIPVEVTGHEDLEPLSGKETILVIEDEDLVRETVRLLLEELGYAVVCVEDGPAALAKLSAGQTADLLFSDVIMPGGMTGHELAQEVSRSWPEIKILLTSGYPRDAFHEGRKYPLICKPYTQRHLAHTIRDVLEGKDVEGQ